MIFKNKSTKIIGFYLLFTFWCYDLCAQNVIVKDFSSLKNGDQRFDKYLPLLKGKRVAVITNITGKINSASIVDTLLQLKVKLVKIFGPEHGFRGDTEAGDAVDTGTDTKTGLPVISLYGKNKKPSKEQLKDVDVVLYDIQDVGVRFYTYISTMCYAMEACAENKKAFMVLDRPNPNGFYIDGPVLQKEFSSFLGLHPVPLVYGMTCGEYAKMANGEGWLKNKVKCNLTVIPMQDYDRKCTYRLPHDPSPNLRSLNAILLYPTMGLFEGTIMSLGRGTAHPFEQIGHPQYPDTNYYFVPKAGPVSLSPKYLEQKCFGVNLENSAENSIKKEIDLNFFRKIVLTMKKEDFFDNNFNFHSGNKELKEQIRSRISIADIRKGWETDLAKFRKIRSRYLLYSDF